MILNRAIFTCGHGRNGDSTILPFNRLATLLKLLNTSAQSSILSLSFAAVAGTPGLVLRAIPCIFSGKMTLRAPVRPRERPLSRQRQSRSGDHAEALQVHFPSRSLHTWTLAARAPGEEILAFASALYHDVQAHSRASAPFLAARALFRTPHPED